jgi:hypothetical protein
MSAMGRKQKLDPTHFKSQWGMKWGNNLPLR